MSKICNNCGKTVNDNANFCPNCKSQSFRTMREITPSTSNTVLHTLLYWNYTEGYVLSKTKIISWLTLFILMTLVVGPAPAGVILVSLIIAGIVFLLGFAIHNLLKKPSNIKIINNDFGLKSDLIHLFLFWQNNEGYFVLSKTKVISLAVFVLFLIVLSFANPPSLFALCVEPFVFAIPSFIIGYAIHKLTNPNPQPKTIEMKTEEKLKVKSTPEITSSQSKNEIIPEYLDYQIQLDELNTKFIKKEKSTRQLIEKRFEPPQLTYTRFITGVDKSSELFKKHLNSAYTMLNLADEYSPRISDEIESKISILKSILEKLNILSNELILNENLSNKEDVNNLIDEMDDLIKSVKEYD